MNLPAVSGYTAGRFFILSPLLIVTLLITLLVLVPIDNDINVWTAAALPSDFEKIRRKWKTFHALRTPTSVANFAFYSLFIFANYDRKNRLYPLI